MTKAEAIKQLKNLKEHCEEMSKSDEDPWADDVKALEMAIEAMEGKDDR